MKTCTKCGKLKKLTDYHKHCRTKDGYRPRCKECHIADEEARRRAAGTPKKEIHYCKVKRCETRVKGFGYCEKHLDRVKRNGSIKRQYPPLKIYKDGTAVCKDCGERKPARDFHPRRLKTGRISYSARCSPCEQIKWSAGIEESRRRGYAKRKLLLKGAKSEPYRRLDIFERDGWICQLCSDSVDSVLKGRDRWAPTIDHVIPLSWGGDDIPENVQLAHFRCNASKSNRRRADSEDALVLL